jgi:hypothetical protein
VSNPEGGFPASFAEELLPGPEFRHKNGQHSLSKRAHALSTLAGTVLEPGTTSQQSLPRARMQV